MRYSVLIHKRSTDTFFECKTITSEGVTVTYNRVGTPGECKFNVLKSGALDFHEGDTVTIKYDNVLEFFGTVFTKRKNHWGDIEVKAYDWLRYLKAKASYQFTNLTVGEIIKKIAGDFNNIPVSDIDYTGYRIPYLLKEKTTCLDIITDANRLTTINTGKIFNFFDDGKGLSLKESTSMMYDLVIGNKSLASSYEYTTDIDSDTYNSIKLVQPNKKTGKADVYIEKDSNNIKRWNGVLQLYETVDEKLTPAQIAEMCKTRLKYYNRVMRTLTLEALGIPGLKAGAMLFFNIPELGDLSLSKWLIVDRVVHTLKESMRTMKLDTRII